MLSQSGVGSWQGDRCFLVTVKRNYREPVLLTSVRTQAAARFNTARQQRALKCKLSLSVLMAACPLRCTTQSRVAEAAASNVTFRDLEQTCN